MDAETGKYNEAHIRAVRAQTMAAYLRHLKATQQADAARFILPSPPHKEQSDG